ncbi:MAG: nucleoside-diphosphate sugar epimerase/dehydratase [Flavobacteriaceae bacterium]|nr:nucleoside-diphosphate sugar epimerase/dehydratase [Flavobacteriaceae bacterium]
MLKRLFKKGVDANVSRWVVLLIDVFIVLQAFILAYLINFDFNLSFQRFGFFAQSALITLLAILCFLIVGSYRGTVRQTGMKDALSVFYGVSILFGILLLITSLDREYNITIRFAVPFRVIVLHYLLNIILLIASRFIFKRFVQRVLMAYKPPVNTMIYGAGDSGLLTYATLNSDLKNSSNVVGFIDDDNNKIGKKYNRVKVYSPKKITESFIQSKNIKEVIVSIQNVQSFRLMQIVDSLIELPVKVKIVPSVDKWINGDLNVGQITEVKIEDLLDRSPIQINNPILQKELNNKTVLITGAAGSIGSEIARQISNYNYKHLVILDQAESDLYDVQQTFIRNDVENYSTIIADIRNEDRLSDVFNAYNFDIVFHAAAYKHVPLMEDNPYEAVKVNVFGSKVLMDLAAKHEVAKFVMVSTDKAVNPTNVMGATKRIAEIYASCLNKESKTKFVTTRFGNVLGSNGSVIPLFKKQLKEGGPLTVTHKEITRYFMTIPEACQLVLEAGVMGKGGEIFVFDMGESVKIFDIAKKMINLSGLRYPEDIDIKIVGLRPGEKLYEELLTTNENTIPTYNEKIMIAKVEAVDYLAAKKKIIDLSKLGEKGKMDIVMKLKEIVPEYISNNSEFEELDKVV